MTMKILLAEHQRLSILLALNAAPGFDLNTSILSDVLKGYSLQCGRDQMRTQLTWLEQQGCVTIEKLGNDNVWIAKITQTGIDVAEGTITLPGIKRKGVR